MGTHRRHSLPVCGATPIDLPAAYYGIHASNIHRYLRVLHNHDVSSLRQDMTNNDPVAISQASLHRAIVLGALLVAVDAFFLNQGAVSLLVGIWLIVVVLPHTFLAKQYAKVRVQRLRNIAVYLVAVILVFLLNAANKGIAQSRADILVAAVKAFNTKNERYPGSLEELVPDHIERVPFAKYTFFLNRFSYYTSDQGTSLFYVDLPPFGRPTYSFTRNEWGYID